MGMHSKGTVVHQRLHCATDPSERAFPCSEFSPGRTGCGYMGCAGRMGGVSSEHKEVLPHSHSARPTEIMV